jgi:hypothetical protein
MTGKGRLLADLNRRVYSVSRGHLDIGEHEVRFRDSALFDKLAAVLCDRNDDMARVSRRGLMRKG